MLKKSMVLIATAAISCCTCDHPDTINYNIHKVKPGHHYYDPYHHHLLYGGGLIYYLTFLAIKVKVLFVLGAIFTFFLFAGKLYALIKFGEYMKVHHHHEPEKIYVQSPSHHYESSLDFHSNPIRSVEDYTHGLTASDKFLRPLQPTFSRYATIPTRYRPGAGGRFLNTLHSEPTNPVDRHDANFLHQAFNLFSKFVGNVNLTEIIFSEMDVLEETCKKEWICQIERFAKGNWLLERGLTTLSDVSYATYKVEQSNDTSLQDCQHLYDSRCHNNHENSIYILNI